MRQKAEMISGGQIMRSLKHFLRSSDFIIKQRDTCVLGKKEHKFIF